MDEKILHSFIKMTEKMVSPSEIAKVFYGAQMLRKLPQSVQHYFAEKGSKQKPYIGFIVEPYSFFLAFEIKNEHAAEKFLPQGYELLRCSFYEEAFDERKYAIIGCFNVRSSFFQGTRYELYLIARNTRTDLLTWIICDYESDTISYDPGHGFLGPTTKHSVCTTSFDGHIIIDVESSSSENALSLKADIHNAKKAALNKRLWIEGNLSVDYSGDLTDSKTKPFGLIFDPNEMNEVLRIAPDGINITRNTFGSAFINTRPAAACCFPYAQHFMTTSFPQEHSMKTADDLEAAVKKMVERN